tara:strand:- start:2948 stop:3460 length:513 start_codon:yes stop_codon:yes gene_type:complete
MAKINNTTAYPNITPTADDFVVLTDVSDSDATKTCTVNDFQGFFGTKTLVKTLTSAELLNSFTTPIILLAAQGANKVIIPYGTVVYKTDFNTTVYDFTDAFIQYESTIYNTVTTTVLNAAADYISPSEVTATGGTSIVGNNNLLFKASTGNPTQGDGTLTINLQYRIVEI